MRDAEEKAAALEAVIEHIAPGRTADARAPSEKELAATAVVSMRLDEASAKVREGGPIDEPDDMGLAVWAGALPLAIAPADPVPDQELAAGVALPDYVRDWRRP